MMTRYERTLLPRISDQGPPTASIFGFGVESRYQCSVTGQVRYVSSKDFENTLELRIPLDAAINTAEVEHVREAKKARIEQQTSVSAHELEDVKLHIPFAACLNTVFGSELVEYNNPSVGHRASATKSIKLKNFPRYLMVKLARYYVGPNWVQVTCAVNYIVVLIIRCLITRVCLFFVGESRCACSSS